MTAAQKTTRGRVLAVTVCVLSAFCMLVAIAASTDRSAWGATLVVGTLGPIGGIVLAILGCVAAVRAEKTWVIAVAWVGVAMSVTGIILSLLLWSE